MDQSFLYQFLALNVDLTKSKSSACRFLWFMTLVCNLTVVISAASNSVTV